MPAQSADTVASQQTPPSEPLNNDTNNRSSKSRTSQVAQLNTSKGPTHNFRESADLHPHDLLTFEDDGNDEEKAAVAPPVRHPRVSHWSELDQQFVKAKVAAEEAYQKPVDEANLLDGVMDAKEAREAADAYIPVQLKVKSRGKGKKGKKQWLDLTPFVNT